jgi:hypothetical protein
MTNGCIHTCLNCIFHLALPHLQSAREKASKDFRTATSAILFSSDVSARGVDYPDVTMVLQVTPLFLTIYKPTGSGGIVLAEVVQSVRDNDTTTVNEQRWAL